MTKLWAVYTDVKGWNIVDVYSGRSKFIGITEARRTNYYEKAIHEAIIRNRKFGINGYISALSLNLSKDMRVRKIQLRIYITKDPIKNPYFRLNDI